MIKAFHKSLVYNRRVQVLVDVFTACMPSNVTNMLDVGSGDGEIACKVASDVGVNAIGVDVVKRDTNMIPIEIYDGKTIPFDDESFDVVMISDVLHHTESPGDALQEVVRVSKKYILIKDHYCENNIAFAKLKLMDWVGNSYCGVPLPYNYLSKSEWQNLYMLNHLVEVNTETVFQLYPPGLQKLFGDGLHFVTLLKKN